jgi:hypothetical protein
VVMVLVLVVMMATICGRGRGGRGGAWRCDQRGVSL